MPENNSYIDINEVMKHYLLYAIWTEEEQMSEMEEKKISNILTNAAKSLGQCEIEAGEINLSFFIS